MFALIQLALHSRMVLPPRLHNWSFIHVHSQLPLDGYHRSHSASSIAIATSNIPQSLHDYPV